MTLKQRIIAISAACALMLSGFAFGRITDSPRTTSAEESKSALNQTETTTASTSQAAADSDTFYLKDFKTGYDDGFNAGATGQMSSIVATDREGYNEGFKKGYADAYQTQANPPALANSGGTRTVYRQGQTVYKPAYAPAKRKGSSKLKTALTIAAPAAIGAGIGVAAGGKKGAAIGALVGGGGGALYHLIKNRDR